MRYVWLAIIAITGAPLLFVGMLLNPVFIVVLGTEWWLGWMRRLHPYRWRIVFIALVFGFALTVYLAAYV
jgi:hypothetical protein